MYNNDNRPDETFSLVIGCALILSVMVMCGIGVGAALWFIWGLTKYST